MRFHHVSLIGLLLAVTAPAWATPLTLQECLQQAKDNNPALRAVGWDRSIAREGVRQASAAYLPRIDAQAGYTMQQESQAVIISGRTAETQEPDFAFGGLSASYTIYDFGRRNAAKEKAVSLADSADRQFAARKSDVSLQVIESYFMILESGKLISAATEEVAQVLEHRRVAQVLYEEGVVTRNDVLQADVRLASARQRLLALENSRENGWLRLNFLTGRESSVRNELDEAATMFAASPPVTDMANALARRHDIQALRQMVNVSEAEVKESGSSFYPEIFTKVGLDYVQNDKVREQAIMSATLGIRFNIFDGYASTSTRERAVQNRSRSTDAVRLAEEQARLEIHTAGNDVTVAGERISVAESAIHQSEENLRINKERYQERVGTATEVLDAQTMLTQARTDYFRAFYDRQIAVARLKRAMEEL